MHAELIKINRYPELEIDWRRLEQDCSCPPFLSWAWAGTWLRNIPQDLEVEVFRITNADGKVLALGFLVDTPERGLKRLFGARALRLQETGCSEIDEITLEYAGLLVRRDDQLIAYSALFDILSKRKRNWRALELSASLHADAIRTALPDSMLALSTRESPAYFVKLDELRSKGHDYLSCLSQSTRRTLRKAKAQYEKKGELCTEVATTAEKALDYLREMRKLHDHYWHGKGERSGFDSPFFRRFHEDLLRRHASSGFAQITKLSAGPVLIGYIYNLVWKNGAHFYNSGLNYDALGESDAPGHISFLTMIEKYKNDGIDFYDFMAGSSEYKRRICTHLQTVHWIQIRRRDPWTVCELMLLKHLAGRNFAPLTNLLETDEAKMRGDSN